MRNWRLTLMLGMAAVAASAARCTADTFVGSDGSADASDETRPINDGQAADGGCACQGNATCVSGLCIDPMGDTPCMVLGATGDAHVYWTDARPVGNVYRMTTDGTHVVERLASNQVLPRAIVVDATRVYWATATGIEAADLDGSNPLALQSGLPDRPSALALGATEILFGGPNEIYAASKTSAASPQPIVATLGTPARIRVVQYAGGTLLVWTSNNGSSVDAGTAEFASVTVLDGGLLGAPNLYLAPAGTLRGFDIANGVAFVNHTSNGEILSGPPTAGGPAFWLAAAAPWDVLVDGAKVYWSQATTDGGIYSSATNVPAPTLIQGGEQTPTCIGVDQSHIWWVSSSHPTPVSAAK